MLSKIRDMPEEQPVSPTIFHPKSKEVEIAVDQGDYLPPGNGALSRRM